MNSELSKEVYNTFVPSYKNLASVYQIFNGVMPPTQRVLLEETVLGTIAGAQRSHNGKEKVQVDNLVIKNFINKFNRKYSKSLSENQSRLLQNYILSFSDNGVGLKVFLNEEIGRLREALRSGLKNESVREDGEMVSKAGKILDILESFKHNKITRDSLSQILKIQDLAREIEA
jgi:hypothetical protein